MTKNAVKHQPINQLIYMTFIFFFTAEDTQSRKGTSDLDSVSAHDVDEKFKQILRKRTGKNIYMCDLDSVSAHDVDEKFKQILRKRTGKNIYIKLMYQLIKFIL